MIPSNGDGAAFEGQRPSFTPLPNWLRGQASALEIAVLWVLQSHYPEIRPSLSRLAEEASLSRRTVQKVLADMERKGWLVRVHRLKEAGARDCNLYQLRIWNDQPPAGGRAGDAHRAGDALGGGARDALGVGQEMHGGRAGDAHEEDQQNKINTSRSRKPIEGAAPAAPLWAEQPELETGANGHGRATVRTAPAASKPKESRTPTAKARDPFASKVLPAGVVPADLSSCAQLLAQWWAVKGRGRTEGAFKIACNFLRGLEPADRIRSLEKSIMGGYQGLHDPGRQPQRRPDPNPGPPLPVKGICVSPHAVDPNTGLTLGELQRQREAAGV
jgi:hypothetical protein